jgi:sulfur-carrier protein
MTVTVLLFASYADVLGGSSMDLDLEEGSTVKDLIQRLRGKPGGDRLPAAPLVAINQAWARLIDPIHVGDELAVIPPVAGG